MICYAVMESSYQMIPQGYFEVHMRLWNGKDLTEAEEIKKRWQEYKELYKKGVNDSDNQMVWSLT